MGSAERLIIEVPPDLHAKIKARAATQRKSLKAYVVGAIENFSQAAVAALALNPDRESIDGSWHQKRIVVEVLPIWADLYRAKAIPFKTFREFALRCIEVEIASTQRRRSRFK